MKIEYDNEIDALYIRLQEKYVDRTVEIEEGLNIDALVKSQISTLFVIPAKAGIQ
jgi:uncharacterized protein YuzE